jgi:glycosyltransferase involved in cell wall biosynthesis
MKIQILIPCYNGEKTIARCLDSIKKQTYKDIEVIFLDDCSTDKTAEIAKTYDITYYKNEPNLGRGMSRNKLLELADTEYCCWCDADDYMIKNKIEEQVKYIKENPDCNFLATEMFDMKKGQITGVGCNKAHMINDLTYEKLVKTNCINHPTVMFKLDVARKYGFADMKRNEDWDFYKKIYKDGFKVDAVAKELYVYNL